MVKRIKLDSDLIPDYVKAFVAEGGTKAKTDLMNKFRKRVHSKIWQDAMDYCEE